MDFDDFARQFRHRTAARLVEFEKTLAKAQEELEKSAKNAARQHDNQHHNAVDRVQVNQPPGVRKSPGRREVPGPNAAAGQIKSVLRRG